MADLTVMTWNIQNLFPVGQGDGPATQQEYDAKVAALGEVIDAVEPDVLALQEVGPEPVLADLDAACSIEFGHRLVGVADGRGIRVALLSPRRLSNRVDLITYPQGVAPVQSRDLIFDDPATAQNEALSNALGRGVLSATVRPGGERGHGRGGPPQVQARLVRPPAWRGRWQHVRPERRGRAAALCRLRALPPHRRGHGVPSWSRRRVGR
jgi:hypothetical protein